MKFTIGKANIIRLQAKEVWSVSFPNKLRFATKEFQDLKKALSHAKDINNRKQ